MKNEQVFVEFNNLFNLFKEHNFRLYVVGGSVRDFLLDIDIFDMDVVSDATPTQMKEFLVNADYTFARFGNVKLNLGDIKFDITTLRKESAYIDKRHPSKIIFCDSLEEDVKRRDFTINALYMDNNFQIYDFVGGQKDLKAKIIRMIGNANQRIIEDPLRIVRAFRFKINYGFDFDLELEKSINKNKNLLKSINSEKIKEEIRKCHNQKKLIECLNELDVL